MGRHKLVKLEELAARWNASNSSKLEFIRALEYGHPSTRYRLLREAKKKGLLTRDPDAQTEPKPKPKKIVSVTVIPTTLIQNLDEAFTHIFNKEKLTGDDMRCFRRVQNVLERAGYGPK